MRIAFTGAQSTGKTTLLQEMKKKLPGYFFVDEVTRLVKKSYGVNINEAGGTNTQLYILSEHIKNHLNYHENLVLDRCILDGYVYTKYQVERGNVDSNVLDAFNSVFGLLFDKLDVVFYTDPKDVDLEDDGERSSDIKFREDIISIFDNIINFKLSLHNRSKIVVLSGTVEQRVEKILNYIKFLELGRELK